MAYTVVELCELSLLFTQCRNPKSQSPWKYIFVSSVHTFSLNDTVQSSKSCPPLFLQFVLVHGVKSLGESGEPALFKQESHISFPSEPHPIKAE